jgi:hypothetical protein
MCTYKQPQAVPFFSHVAAPATVAYSGRYQILSSTARGYVEGGWGRVMFNGSSDND